MNIGFTPAGSEAAKTSGNPWARFYPALLVPVASSAPRLRLPATRCTPLHPPVLESLRLYAISPRLHSQMIFEFPEHIWSQTNPTGDLTELIKQSQKLKRLDEFLIAQQHPDAVWKKNSQGHCLRREELSGSCSVAIRVDTERSWTCIRSSSRCT